MIEYTKIQAQLEALLPRIVAGEFACAEYGDPAHVGGYASHIRVYYIPTMGGMQFGIKTVSSHVEGSGVYFPDAAGAVDYAMERVHHYHRPLNAVLAKRLAQAATRSERPVLAFTGFTNDDLQASRSFAAGLIAYRGH